MSKLDFDKVMILVDIQIMYQVSRANHRLINQEPPTRQEFVNILVIIGATATISMAFAQRKLTHGDEPLTGDE